MMRSIAAVSSALLLLVLASSSTSAQTTGAGPTVVVETSRGTFEFETYPDTAPKTVAHVTGLAKKGFYTGIRIHRVVPGFVIQFGDPQTRDMTKKAMWGSGGSGTMIGVAEISKKRTHVKGAVAMAHAGDPAKAESQIYVTLGPQPRLDSGYTVFGQITSGMDIIEKIEAGDVIKDVTVK
jgi:cyclophilin family peptidyl-prolyl cis-trans isomerase